MVPVPPALVYTRTCTQYNYTTVTLVLHGPVPVAVNPFLSVAFSATFVRPVSSGSGSGGTAVTAAGFYDGVDDSSGGAVFRVRAYCDVVGAWSFTTACAALRDLDGVRGQFDVVPLVSTAASAVRGSTSSSTGSSAGDTGNNGTGSFDGRRGKLRLHAHDHFQFQYDTGEWFLHVGDTGYRYAASAWVFSVHQWRFWKEGLVFKFDCVARATEETQEVQDNRHTNTRHVLIVFTWNNVFFRYVIPGEPQWQQYIDQAAAQGFTKIRTWFTPLGYPRHELTCCFV